MKYRAAKAASKVFRFPPIPIPTGNRGALLHTAGEKPSNQRCLQHNVNDPLSPASQIVDIIRLQHYENWKSDARLNEILSTSPLSADQFLRITRRLPSSDTALKFVEHLRSNSCQLEPGSLSYVFQAAFELSIIERISDDKLWRILEKSKEMGIPLSINSATLLIRRFSRSVDRAIEVYNGVEPRLRNVNVRNLVLSVLFEHGSLEDALKVFDEMLEPDSEVCPNEATVKVVFDWILNSVMTRYDMNEEVIVDLLSKLGESGLINNSQELTELIAVSYKKGKESRNFAALDLMHCFLKMGRSVEASCCNSLLSWLTKKGEFEKFVLLVKEMKNNGIVSDKYTLGNFVKQLCNAGRMNESMEMLKEMRVKPDTVIYNMIIDGFCKVGRSEQGLEFMRKMKLEGNFVPTTATYNCLIDRFCRAGEMKKSLELFDEMKRDKIEPNVITYNCLINGMCKQGKVNTAFKLFHEMKGNRLDGNVKTYNTLISAFCDVNNIRKAMELFDEMKQNCKPDAIAYCTLILGFVRGGRMDAARYVMSSMREAGFRPDIGCYNAMISGYCKRKKIDRACQLLKDMEIDGTKPTCVTYNTLISYFSKSGDFEMAHTLLKRMVNEGLTPTVVTYGTLIHAYCLAGSFDDAMKIFNEMHSSGKVPLNVVIYNSLIDNLCKSRQVEAALLLFEDMTVKGVQPNTNTFNAMLKGLKDIKWLEKAFELMDSMIRHGCNPDYVTMSILTDWLPSVGETDRLRKFVHGFQVSDQ